MKKISLPTNDGPTQELFADGTVSGEGKMKSGKRHGKWKFYYRNGQTKAVGKYADGELDGFWEWWRENGQPLQAGAFANRVQVGAWKRYYENGQLWDEGEYKDGKFNAAILGPPLRWRDECDRIDRTGPGFAGA